MTSNATTDSHRDPNYVKIFVVLIVLFVISVGAAFIGSPGLAVAAAFTIALAKAALVLMYFMHLKYEPVWIAILLAFCLFFVIAMFLGMIPDIVYVYGG